MIYFTYKTYKFSAQRGLRMTLQQIHYAITIAENGSLNKAAEILYIAQPFLTSSMQELERELGITISNRSGRGVTLTPDGIEFLQHAKQVYTQYETLTDKYGNSQNLKKKFGVSTQHYSFAVKAFVELVKSFDTSRYEFAIRETKTKDVISDVTLTCTLRICHDIPCVRVFHLLWCGLVFRFLQQPNSPFGYFRFGRLASPAYRASSSFPLLFSVISITSRYTYICYIYTLKFGQYRT